MACVPIRSEVGEFTLMRGILKETGATACPRSMFFCSKELNQSCKRASAPLHLRLAVMTAVQAMPVEVPGIREGAAAGIRGVALAGTRLVRTTDEGGRTGQEDETCNRTHEMCFHSDESDANSSKTFKRMCVPSPPTTLRWRIFDSHPMSSKQSTKVAPRNVTLRRKLQCEHDLFAGCTSCVASMASKPYQHRHIRVEYDMEPMPA
jgi:hypothetical protein